MHGSCTCCDSHAAVARLMITSPRIAPAFKGTAPLTLNPVVTENKNNKAALAMIGSDFMRNSGSHKVGAPAPVASTENPIRALTEATNQKKTEPDYSGPVAGRGFA